jgi:hypothetical protein
MCTGTMRFGTFHLLLLASGAIVTTAGAQACERFETLSLDEQTHILAGNNRSDAECTAFILKNLRDAHYEPATRAIAKYLNFRLAGACRLYCGNQHTNQSRAKCHVHNRIHKTRCERKRY